MTEDGNAGAGSDNWLALSDDALVAQCRMEAVRGSGPGGQKRNKTSNAIHLRHLPTGLHVVAGETRSQSLNKARAIRRLKLKIATDLRRPVDWRGFEPPPWLLPAVQGGRLVLAHGNGLHPRVAALILDLLESRSGSMADAATLLGVTTSSMVKFLIDEPKLWAAANRIRHAAGLPPVKKG